MNPLSNEDLNTIVRVATQVSPKYCFGSHEREDMIQEGIRIGLEGLRHYKEELPLENFMRVHIKNRLINFKRDNYYRYEKTADATKAAVWAARNKLRQNLMSPLEISEVEHKVPLVDNVIEDASYNELIHMIKVKLPAALRTDFLRMVDGVSLPAIRRIRIQEEVQLILQPQQGGQNEAAS